MRRAEQMTNGQAERDRQALTTLARTLTQAEWDRRFPPLAPSDSDPEPYDPEYPE